MKGNRFGGGVAGVLVGVAIILGGVALLQVTRDVVPPFVGVGICGALAVAGLTLIVASVALPRALIWRRDPSGSGYLPVAPYFAPPGKAPEGVCWHCGAHLGKRATICAVCGATRAKRRFTLLPSLRPARRAPGPAAVVPSEPRRPRRDPSASAFPLYAPGERTPGERTPGERTPGGRRREQPSETGHTPPERPSRRSGLTGLPPLPELPESLSLYESSMWPDDSELAE